MKFFVIFKHSWATKRYWKIFHRGSAEFWIFLSVKEREPRFPLISFNTMTSVQQNMLRLEGETFSCCSCCCCCQFPALFGVNTLRWEGAWRELSSLTKTTAFAVREQSGPSLKSALRVCSISSSCCCCYLCQGGNVFARLCLLVCLSLCQQDNSKSYGRIFLKF